MEYESVAHDGLLVEVEWSESKGGASRIVIQSMDRRPITSTRLRKAEALAGYARKSIKGKASRSTLATVDEILGKLRDRTPRSDGDLYYRLLLDGFSYIKTYAESPVSVMADRLGIPKNTLKTRLHRAREIEETGLDLSL